MPTTPPPTTIDYDQFVDTRIKQTRTAVKVTDLASGIATLLAAGLAFLLVAALVEHWLVPGGFSTGERAGLLGVVLVGGVIYSAHRLLPVIVGRVNPLYAAIEIERDAPELKNSLVNLLQLRSSGATSKLIQQTLEQQAAERLASSSEATIDREGLLRIGYVLLGLVAVIGLYVVISPKDFFATAGRIALPWADIAAPTRVQIMDVTPGATTVSQGDTIEVSARLSGLQEDDIVELIYSARDGRTIDRRVTMQTDESGIRYRALLGSATGLGRATRNGRSTGSGLGLQTNVQYRLAAGDARSLLYRVQVLSSPTIAPVSVTYDYPDYTGYVDRTVEGAGDLEAIEGTRVKLTVEANLAIESAQIDLDADGTPDIRLQADGQNAIASFTLRRDGERAGVSRESVYVIRFTSEDGQTNTDPARHHLLVKPDLVPEAAILLPKEDAMDVALNGEVEIEIEARDPDFALASVRLLGEVKGRSVLKNSLLGRSKKGHTGKFFVRQTLSPELLGLSVGDVLTYWVEATDNRSPEANRVVTTRKRLRVVGSQTKNGKGGDPQEGQQEGQQGEANEDPTQGNQTGEEGSEGDSSSEDSSQQPGENDQQENGDPQSSAAGDQQQEGQQSEGQQGEQQQNQQQQGEQEQGQQGEHRQAEEADPDGGSQGDPPPGGIQGDGKENPDSKSGDNQQGGAAGESSGDDKKEGNGEAGGASGDDQSGENPSGNDNQTGERRPGTPTGGDQQSVAQDGSDDGEAFDRMRKHMAEEGAKKKGEGESSPKDSEQDSGKGQPSEGDSSKEGDATADETGEVHHGTEDSTDQLNDSHADSPERSVDGEAPEAGNSGQQSDSQSSEQGESGGEESSTEETTTPHDGTGSAGQSQAADEGSGQAGDQGAGDRSGQAGDQQAAEKPTGQSSGDQPGQGSQTGEGDQPGEGEKPSNDGSAGDQAGSDSASSGEGTPSESGESSATDSQGQNGSPSSANGNDGQKNNQRRDPSEKRDPLQGDAPGGERDRDSQLPDDDKLDGEPGGDEANLDYARKQTDLVLKRLSEQFDKNAVDKELLEKLGWTEEDLRRFVSRWQDRQDQAATGDQGKSELDSALRSLGLDQKGPTATGKLKKDQLRDLRQRTRTSIPPALRDRLRPYNRGVSASHEE